VDIKNKGTGKKRRGTLVLTRKGRVGTREFRIKKSVTTLGSSSFIVSYEVQPVSPASRKKEFFRFGVELNLILPACAGPACSYNFIVEGGEVSADRAGFADIDQTLESTGELKGVSKVELIDSYTGVKVSVEPKDSVTLWRFPITTVSLSESGFERIFQGSSLLFLFPDNFNDLDEQAIFKSSFVVNIEKI
jgi:alpha-amylase